MFVAANETFPKGVSLQTGHLVTTSGSRPSALATNVAIADRQKACDDSTPWLISIPLSRIMIEVKSAYGHKAYKAWEYSDLKSPDLSGAKSTPDEAAADVWAVDSFTKLVKKIAFLTVMNKQSILLYRGQALDLPLVPTLFRSKWRPFDSGKAVSIADSVREEYWRHFGYIGEELYNFCKKSFGLPRWRGMRDETTIRWAVAQHYGVWPTPLLDLTSSLRVATSFAFGLRASKPSEHRTAFLFVFDFPVMGGSHGPILKSEDDSMVLARLQACCPPAAIRAHLQDGYLAGDYSILKYPQWYNDLERDSNLQRRLIAKFRLHDNGEFWNQAYPVLTDESLLPLKDRFIAEVKGHLGAEIERRIKTLS